MALSDRYVAPDTRSRFEKWFDALDPKHSAVILGWMNDPELPNVKILEWIRDDDPTDGYVGIRVNKDAIANWRNKHVAR